MLITIANTQIVHTSEPDTVLSTLHNQLIYFLLSSYDAIIVRLVLLFSF